MAEPLIRVHYHRHAGDYAGVSLWTWDEHRTRTPKANELSPAGRDEFGAVFEVDAALYGNPGDRIGLLPRMHRNWELKDGPDRYWSPGMGDTVYIVQNDPRVYADRPTLEPGRHNDLSLLHDADARLGTTYTTIETTFRVFAPTASAVRVVIADHVANPENVRHQTMTRNDHGVWEIAVRDDLADKCYAYQLSGPGFDDTREVTDVYATCTQNRHVRSLIVDLRKTDPPGFREQEYTLPDSPTDAIIYELHVRDFTIARNAGVKHRGKYLGLTETGTHLPDDDTLTTSLDHLTELGVTHVQLMPIQDFDNDEDSDDYAWGYMPVFFNSPDGWYATSPRGSTKIRELKQAIQALHARDIGVILDVVYNHTAPRATFDQLVPNYYFRRLPSGALSNGSGCGNEFKSEHPMARKFILDSLKFWVEEYRVDGFRFDLMGLIDVDTMKRIYAELKALHPRILIHGEPWTAGKTPLDPICDKKQIRGTGIAAFNDHFRDAIKGDRDGGAPGFIQTGDRMDGIHHGLLGGITDWAKHPTDTIAYFAAHDNLTAWDKLTQTHPNTPLPIRERMMRLGALILLASQGRPFIHSGQEFCRTKRGNSNSYNAPDEINQIDWSLKKRHGPVYDYYQGMIALRRAHPIFRLPTRDEVEARLRFNAPPQPKCVVLQLDGSGLAGESAEAVLVLLNGQSKEIRFPLPDGRWRVYADGERAGVEPFDDARRHITLPAHSGMILMR